MGEFAAVMEADQAPPETPAAESAPVTPDTSPVTPDTPPVSETPPAADPSVPLHPPASPPPVPGAPAPPTAPPSSKLVPLQALQEARTQTKALKDTYGWLPQDHAPAIRAFYEQWQRDPISAIVGELQDLLQHPQHGPQLRALMRGGTETPPAHQAEAEPEPDLQTADGTLVYSAPQLQKWRQWSATQDEAKFEARLQPLQTYVQGQQREAALSSMRAKATDSAKALFSEMRAYPHFETHKAAIKARFSEYASSMGGREALQKAYLDVLHTEILPTLSQRERTAVVSQLQQKPGASSPNPARPGSPAGTRAPLDFREAAERLIR